MNPRSIVLHIHARTRPTTGRYKKRRRRRGRRKRGQRYREIKGKLMSSVWICMPWGGCFSGCVCSVIGDVNVLLCQPNPPPARATLARAHYHPMTQSVCQDTQHTYYTFITPRHDWPVPTVQQPYTYPHQPPFHRCSLSNIQCQQLRCQEGQFVCFQ